MEKKIASLKAAYAARDQVKVRNAARAVVAHSQKHPFAALCQGEVGIDIVRLAKRICAAPSLAL